MRNYLLVLAVLGAVNCHAQFFGARAGLNLSNIGSDAVNNSIRPGYHLGVYYSTSLADNLWLEPELQYSAQGSNAEDETSAFDQTLSYLNIPMTFKYSVGTSVKIIGAPYAGILLAAEARSEAGDFDNKDLFKSIDYGIGLGLEYELSSSLNISARYLFGIADITDESGTQTVVIDGIPVEVDVQDQTITNRVLQVSIGYDFN